MFYLVSILTIWFGFANPVGQFPPGVLLFPLIMYHLSLSQGPVKRVMGSAWLFGAMVYSTCLYWIAYPVINFTSVPLVVAIACPILLGLYLGIYPLLYSLGLWYIKEYPFLLKLPLAIFLWSFIEYLRGHLFTGLPWLSLCQAFAHYPWSIQAIRYIGPYLLSGVFSGIAICIYEIGRKRSWAILPAALLSLLLYLPAFPSSPIPSKGFISCGAVQGNINQYHKWDTQYQDLTLHTYLSLTTEAISSLHSTPSPALVVWPETAMPFYFTTSSPHLRKILRFTILHKIILLTGAPGFRMRDRGVSYFNSAYLIVRGKIVARYDKVHLVPFGEYVPLSRYFPFLKKMVQGPGDFTPGTRLYPLRWRNLAIGTLICYEVIFPELVAREVQRGANLLVNISNDAWFGDSSGPYQHLNQAILRAVETNRYLIRSTNDGISAIISPRGKVVRRLWLFKQGEITYDKVALVETMTFYTRHWRLLRYVILIGTLIPWGIICFLKVLAGSK